MQRSIPTIADLVQRAEGLDYPLIIFAGSQHLAGQRQWEAARDGAVPLNPADLEEIERGLLAEAGVQERQARATERAEAAAQRTDPDAPDPREGLDADRAAEAVAAARHAGTTEGLLERVCGLLEDIKAELLTR